MACFRTFAIMPLWSLEMNYTKRLSMIPQDVSWEQRRRRWREQTGPLGRRRRRRRERQLGWRSSCRRSRPSYHSRLATCPEDSTSSNQPLSPSDITPSQSDIKNQKSKWPTTTPLTLGEKMVNFGPLTKKVINAPVDPPKINIARAMCPERSCIIMMLLRAKFQSRQNCLPSRT